MQCGYCGTGLDQSLATPIRAAGLHRPMRATGRATPIPAQLDKRVPAHPVHCRVKRAAKAVSSESVRAAKAVRGRVVRVPTQADG